MIPLAYVIRPEADIPVATPALAPGEPYSLEHGSVEQELVACALFPEDNSDVYYKLEEAMRGTLYMASIKPFQRAKQGREAWLAITGQYAGKDKWAAEIKQQEQLLHTRVWKGQSNFSLEKFITQHRNAFVSMQACAERIHSQYQLPNGRSRVGFLLDAIQCSDAGLQAAMASIRTDDRPDGMRNDFEQSAAHLLPYDPVGKKHAAGSSKRGSANVSALSYEATDVAAFGTRIGKSGVHFRYYDKSKYSKLMKEQKTELCEWQSKGGAERDRSDAKSKKAKFNKAVAAAVEKKISEQKKANEEVKMAGDKLRSLVASIIKETREATSTSRRTTTVGAATTTSKSSNPTMQKWGRPMSPEAVWAKQQWNIPTSPPTPPLTSP